MAAVPRQYQSPYVAGWTKLQAHTVVRGGPRHVTFGWLVAGFASQLLPAHPKTLFI